MRSHEYPVAVADRILEVLRHVVHEYDSTSCRPLCELKAVKRRQWNSAARSGAAGQSQPPQVVLHSVFHANVDQDFESWRPIAREAQLTLRVPGRHARGCVKTIFVGARREGTHPICNLRSSTCQVSKGPASTHAFAMDTQNHGNM